jgi:phosphopantetheinyl transferase
LIKAFLNSEDNAETRFALVDMNIVRRDLVKNSEDTLRVLSPKEHEILNQYSMPKKSLQWLCGRIGVKRALEKLLEPNGFAYSPDKIDVLNGLNSAPFLVQYPDLHTSITHCYPFCICVVSKHRIGIDLEKHFDITKDFISMYYAEKEVFLISRNLKSEISDFLALYFWTRKEALSKLLKLGMNLDFRRLDTSKRNFCIPNFYNINVFLKSKKINEFCISIAYCQ